MDLNVAYKHKRCQNIFTFMHVKITPHLNQTNSIDVWLSMRLLLLLLVRLFLFKVFARPLSLSLFLSPLFLVTLCFITGIYVYFICQSKIHSIDVCASNKVKTIYTKDKIMFMCLVCACCCKSLCYIHFNFDYFMSLLALFLLLLLLLFLLLFLWCVVCGESDGSVNLAWNIQWLKSKFNMLYTRVREYFLFIEQRTNVLSSLFYWQFLAFDRKSIETNWLLSSSN